MHPEKIHLEYEVQSRPSLAPHGKARSPPFFSVHSGNLPHLPQCGTSDTYLSPFFLTL
jgi:hypothetical protein